MSLKQMFAVLRHKEIAPSDWKVEGPGGKSYKVISHKREFVSDKLNCGKITFEVQAGESAASRETLVGYVGTVNAQGNAMIPDGNETITRDGAELPDPDIDGGVAGTPVLRGFPPKLKLRGSVIIKFRYRDDREEDDTAEYRFEARFGEIGMI